MGADYDPPWEHQGECSLHDSLPLAGLGRDHSPDFGLADVELNVHAGPVPALVKFPVDTDWRQVRVLRIKGPAINTDRKKEILFILVNKLKDKFSPKAEEM